MINAGSMSSKIIRYIRDNMIKECIHYNSDHNLYYYSGYGKGIFTYEMFFDSITLIHLQGVGLSINTLRIYLDFQKDNGLLLRYWSGPKFHNKHGQQGWCAFFGENMENVWEEFVEEEHAQPVLFQMSLLLSRARGNVDWITNELYIKLKKYLILWLDQWDKDKNGLLEWASAPHAMADNQFDRVGTFRSFYCEGVDLNCMIYMELLAAEKISNALGNIDDSQYFINKAGIIKENIQKNLWDEEEGFFYDRDIRTGERIRVKAAHNLIPLWSKIATPAQAERIVNEHIKNDKEFWSQYPLPSYAMNEPHYTQYHVPEPGVDLIYALPPGHCNWCGGMWPQTNYMICHGLINYGYKDEALHIANQSFRLIEADPNVHEWYNAETGEGQGAQPLWSGAQILMSLLKTEIETGFNPSIINDIDVKLGNDYLRKVLNINDNLDNDISLV